MAKIRKVMMASDFSSASRAAFARAVELAKANRATLLVMHAVTLPPPTLGGEYLPPQAWDRIEAASRTAAQKQIAQLLARARRAGVRATGVIGAGSPYELIARVARSRRADVLVLGTHGRTGLSRFFLGSVAARVLATAPCPVLTVRGR
ncbi:MAG TPA: universal stress protein [Methylomirabilota bacterium]|nr:universal stress protein [Methylomirabilota bacterium]